MRFRYGERWYGTHVPTRGTLARRAVFGDRLSFWEALMAEEARAVQHAAHRSRSLTPGWDGTADLSRYAYAQRGMYKRQLETWLQYFPREQLLILCYEQFIAEPAATCRRVVDYLGLPPFAFDVSTRYNPGHYAQPMGQRCRDHLTELLRPHNRAFFEFLGQDWGWPS